jgi:hypothetical protein
MSMSQPDWKCIAQLGDVSPMEYGGTWLFVDKTGVYCPELEFLLERDEESKLYTVYRILCEKCTFENGILSDNKFHKDYPAWFAKDIESVASCVDVESSELIEQLCSDDALQRATGYLNLVSYYGHYEFDDYPLTLKALEAYSRYRGKRYRIQTEETGV